MLVQFRVENHRSLRDEQVLSMVAAKTGDKDDARLIRRDELAEALLPAVALYGANASGKSNVLSALGFMRDAVLRSHRLWEPESGTPQEAFALSSKANEPSLYEVDIFVGEIRFRYGFVLSAAMVEEEWLYAWPRGRKQTWFTREGDTFDFGKNLHGENETIRGLTRANSLFLSAAAQNNHAMLLPIFGWFRGAQLELRRGLGHGMTNAQLARLGNLLAPRRNSSSTKDNATRKHEREAVVRLLRAADVGIVDIRVEGREPVHLEGWSSRSWVPQGTSGTWMLQSSGGKRFDVHLQHKTDDLKRAWLPLEWESAGTITLLTIATRLVGVLREGGLLCIDELEASLHPMLALELVRLFNDPKHNPRGAQLIFTTHYMNLIGNVLGEQPLRRDQIWFTEKDQSGATKLYPLTDFHPRKEENLERGYLQGRYGAIAFLGDLVADPNGSEGR